MLTTRYSPKIHLIPLICSIKNLNVENLEKKRSVFKKSTIYLSTTMLNSPRSSFRINVGVIVCTNWHFTIMINYRKSLNRWGFVYFFNLPFANLVPWCQNLLISRSSSRKVYHECQSSDCLGNHPEKFVIFQDYFSNVCP